MRAVGKISDIFAGEGISESHPTDSNRAGMERIDALWSEHSDGLIFANERLIEQIRKDQAPDQVANVATLPGIQVASFAMPDILRRLGVRSAVGAPITVDGRLWGVVALWSVVEAAFPPRVA